MNRLVCGALVALAFGSPVALVAAEIGNTDPFGLAGNDPVIVERETGYLDELAQRDFMDAYASHVKLRVFVFPAFSGSHAVGIRETDGVFTIFGLQRASRASIWELALAAWNHRLAELSKEVEGRVWRCEAPIDAALANRLMRVSETMLREGLLDDPFGLDGETYLVGMPTPMGVLQGRTWSPDPGSTSALFTDVAYTMGRLCVWYGYLYQQQLDARVRALESKIIP